MTDPDREQSRTRMADVAEEAGVSAATVSRVLNKTAPVSGPVRARVEAAADALGYRLGHPPAGVTLEAVALVITDILNPFFAEVVRGVEDEVENEGLVLLLFNTIENPSREERILNRLLQMDLHGIILFGSRLTNEKITHLPNRRSTPIVTMNRQIRHENIGSVLVDSEQATRRATAYLIGLGHQKIGYLAGPPTSESSIQRLRGIEKALSGAGLSLNDEHWVSGFPDSEGGFQAMSQLLRHPDPPTAVLAYNDVMALGALHAAHSRDIPVPEALSIIGFDDISVAAHTSPPLTTIAQPKYRMGKRAAQLLSRIRSQDALPGDGEVLLESPLVIRESTAPPRAKTG